MPTHHIEAKEGDFAKVVLMPGDPKRARWIAETFLKEPRLVNAVRGALAYTGKTPGGFPVSVMASGMGMPSIGIYSHELYESYGVEAIIRIGTMGTYQENIGLRDIVLAEGASTDSNFLGELHLGGTFSATADFSLLLKAIKASIDLKLPYHVGNILSSDIFYDLDSENWKKWQRLGITGVEMEAYALYANAALLKKRALAICTVTDSFVGGGSLSIEERQAGVKDMVKVALLTADLYTATCRK